MKARSSASHTKRLQRGIKRSWLQVSLFFATGRNFINELISGWKQCSNVV